jgi:hypothetical protein
MHGTPYLLGRPSGTFGDLLGRQTRPGQAPERRSLGFRRKPLELKLCRSMHRVLRLRWIVGTSWRET